MRPTTHATVEPPRRSGCLPLALFVVVALAAATGAGVVLLREGKVDPALIPRELVDALPAELVRYLLPGLARDVDVDSVRAPAAPWSPTFDEALTAEMFDDRSPPPFAFVRMPRISPSAICAVMNMTGLDGAVWSRDPVIPGEWTCFTSVLTIEGTRTPADARPAAATDDAGTPEDAPDGADSPADDAGTPEDAPDGADAPVVAADGGAPSGPSTVFGFLRGRDRGAADVLRVTVVTGDETSAALARATARRVMDAVLKQSGLTPPPGFLDALGDGRPFSAATHDYRFRVQAAGNRADAMVMLASSAGLVSTDWFSGRLPRLPGDPVEAPPWVEADGGFAEEEAIPGFGAPLPGGPEPADGFVYDTGPGAPVPIDQVEPDPLARIIEENAAPGGPDAAEDETPPTAGEADAPPAGEADAPPVVSDEPPVLRDTVAPQVPAEVPPPPEPEAPPEPVEAAPEVAAPPSVEAPAPPDAPIPETPAPVEAAPEVAAPPSVEAPAPPDAPILETPATVEAPPEVAAPPDAPAVETPAPPVVDAPSAAEAPQTPVAPAPEAGEPPPAADAPPAEAPATSPLLPSSGFDIDLPL